jgi:phage/plasmid primase-like uncharacterized protein
VALHINGDARLVIGEGIETVLAAATRIPFEGAPLMPAWSAISSGGLTRFPVINGVSRLIVLADHDIGQDGAEGEGQKAARAAKATWTAAGHRAAVLLPNEPGDFNDVIMRRYA